MIDLESIKYENLQFDIREEKSKEFWTILEKEGFISKKIYFENGKIVLYIQDKIKKTLHLEQNEEGYLCIKTFQLTNQKLAETFRVLIKKFKATGKVHQTCSQNTLCIHYIDGVINQIAEKRDGKKNSIYDFNFFQMKSTK